MTTLPLLTTFPAHPFEPCKRANSNGPGLIDDPQCGFHHRIDDETGVFCFELADSSVHAGVDKPIRIREWTDEEIGARSEHRHSMSRLSGHGLRHEGSAFSMPGQRARDASGPGMGLCECGTYSPLIKNRAQRQQWHKDHKDDIRAGGTGIVWEGADAQ